VAQLERAVGAAAGSAVAAPLADLHERLAGLGDREGAVLERLAEVLGAATAAGERTALAEQELRAALEAAAARTVEDLTRVVEGTGERIQAGQAMGAWQERLAEALRQQQDALGNQARELSALAERMANLQAETRRVVEACDKERQVLPERLAAAVDDVAARIRQSIVPAAQAVDERLGRAEAAQEALREAVERVPARVAEALGAAPSAGIDREALAADLKAAVAPLAAAHERARQEDRERWEALEPRFATTEAACKEVQGLVRAVDLLAGRLSFTQEAFTGQGLQIQQLRRLSRATIGMLLVNILLVVALGGAFAARFLHF
jgi:hypothetical protein